MSGGRMQRFCESQQMGTMLHCGPDRLNICEQQRAHIIRGEQ